MKNISRYGVAVMGLALVLGQVGAANVRSERAVALQAPQSLEVGQPAPGFTLPDQDGKMHHLADYKGKTVILAFYPKDFTGG